VSKSLARSVWPGENPIGKKLQLLSDRKVDGHYVFRTVVGVVGDVRHMGPEGRVPPAIYVPFRQLPVTWMSLVVRAEEPMALVPSIREQVRALDPEIAVFRIGKYEDDLADALLIRRMAMTLIAVFGGMSLFLAAVGLYGLISYAVSRRMHEFGVRAALGARPRDLLQLALGSGLKLVAIGVAIGLVGAWFAARLVTSILTGTGGGNIVAMASAAALLATIGVFASVIPACGAARADPVETLRAE
jgi:ABC-type lipoprotein release transport system permease subunit